MKKIKPLFVLFFLLALLTVLIMFKKGVYKESDILGYENYVAVVLTDIISTDPSDFSTTYNVQKDTISIRSKTDSSAFIRAFNTALETHKINKAISNQYDSYKLKEFQLFNFEGEDITNELQFDGKEILIDSINGLHKLEEKIAEESKKTINELTPFFNIDRDKFKSGNSSFYKPKSAPIYVNRNAIYFYFQVIDERKKAFNLRLRFQYHADDWLFVKKVIFLIDNDDLHEIIPYEVERDNGNGGKIWEWFDEPMNSSDEVFISSLLDANSIEMKIIGSQYSKTKVISNRDLSNLKRSIRLFFAMNGEL